MNIEIEVSFAAIVQKIAGTLRGEVKARPETPQPSPGVGADAIAKAPLGSQPLKAHAPKPPTPELSSITRPPSAHEKKEVPPSDEKPSREHPTHAANGKGAQSFAKLQNHILAVPVAFPVPALPVHPGTWTFARNEEAASSETGDAGKQGTAKPDDERPVELRVLSNVALDIRIRLKPETPVRDIPGTKPPVKAPPSSAELPLQEHGSRRETSGEDIVELPHRADAPHTDVNDVPAGLAHTRVPAAEIASIVPEVGRSAIAFAPVITEGPARRTETAPAGAPQTQQVSASPSNHEILPERAEATQPLRTVSLEFTPDGANDIRLRVSERSGAVHISLHSTDASLSGRLHEGIHDLVGSLSNAGYDAEAWTPNQGRQNQHQPEDPPKKRRTDSSASGAEHFSGMLQQQPQEVL